MCVCVFYECTYVCVCMRACVCVFLFPLYNFTLICQKHDIFILKCMLISIYLFACLKIPTKAILNS